MNTTATATTITMSDAIAKYRDAQYDLSCSEATLYAANEVYQLGLDEKALHLMAGFSGGLMTEDLCGAIAGAVAALSSLLTNHVAHQSPELKVAVQEYLDRADSHFCSRNCAQLKKTHRDQVANSCNPVIFQNAQLLDEVVQVYIRRQNPQD